MTSISSITTQSSNSSSITYPSQIVVSENLKEAVIDHLAYLKEYYDHPEYLQKQSREYAVYRYETFWLPFIAENVDLDIVPPLDVLFVWHTHMLAPIAYASDCERLFGRILPHHVRARSPPLVKLSEQLWTKKYNRTMPYHLDYTTNIQVIPPYSSKIKYPLTQAVERQADFYYNVSLGHFKDSDFLDEAINRYKKFIFLKRLNPQLFVVPMYDIDIIWHTHQLFPEIYRRDMIENLQHVLHHDDTTTDRSPNSKLSTSDHETRHKWFELYGDRLPKNGCMYRGKPSKGLYQYVTDFNFLLECQRYSIYVQLIEHNVSTMGAAKKEIDNKITTVVPLHDHSLGEPLREQVFAQFNSSDQEIFARGSSGHMEAHFDADFNDLSIKLTLKIQQKAGYWPMNYFSTLEEYDISSEKLLPLVQFTQPILSANNSTVDDDPKALYYLYDKNVEQNSILREIAPSVKRLVVGIPALDINTIIVRYDLTEYQEVILDQNYVTQLGTTFLFNLENVSVQQAVHNIQPLHQDEPILLNIRHTFVHDIDIFTATFNNVIFASCHTLNWSQLPLPNQVSGKHDVSVITLNPENEEALIIKDHTGDWGIVKFSKKLFTTSLEEETNEKYSQFSLYRFMPHGHVEEEIIYIDWEDDKWLIGSTNFGIEMNASSISVKRVELNNSMQYICLGSALISRFDKLFKEIFGNSEDETNLATTNGNQSENDSLANDIGKINLNALTGINGTKNTLNGSKLQMATNTV
ncbi:unnamed protein product [Rotaria sp. Silwood2]|nr:unnamed protein product [Rotaria sp. Silwood2]CAF2775649.1 unnamed protein product [Rotaria sp. Silwood2]CAF3028307.1 unnamed protein product [Rotaria sp. Silwood2]CAF3184311.1 unnamed protein product [Rotaria sp. Silwood2]CAF4262564.1 unnamed protein product [Rotaria sp. Silwood2]